MFNIVVRFNLYIDRIDGRESLEITIDGASIGSEKFEVVNELRPKHQIFEIQTPKEFIQV